MWTTSDPSFCPAPVTCIACEVVAVEFGGVVADVFAGVVDVGVVFAEVLESGVEVAEVLGEVVELLGVVEELVVTTEELVGTALEELVDSAEGGTTLKLTVAPHSAREDPSGQQPASVQ
jgi:hypothetical protein